MISSYVFILRIRRNFLNKLVAVKGVQNLVLPPFYQNKIELKLSYIVKVGCEKRGIEKRFSPFFTKFNLSLIYLT